MSNQVISDAATDEAAGDGQAAGAAETVAPEGSQGVGPLRHALIYVPGLADHWYNRKANVIVTQIAAALGSVANPVRSLTAVAAEPNAVNYGPGDAYTADAYTIRDKSPDDADPVCDVYTLNYDENLTGQWENSNLLVQTLVVMWRVIQGFFRLPLALARAVGKNRGKDPGPVLQTGYLMAILVVISLYLIFLIAGVAAIVAELLPAITVTSPSNGVAQTASPFAPPDLPASIDRNGVLLSWVAALAEAVGAVVGVLMIPLVWCWGVLTWLVAWVVAAADWVGGQGRRFWHAAGPLWVGVSAVVALLLAAVNKSRNAIKSAATTFVCAWNYLGDGTRRDAITGQLTALVQHLTAAPMSYDKVHILSYSFGSIAVLDALFPYDRRPSSDYDRIDTLVTMGCPFDIVRTYFPGYFDDRMARRTTEPVPYWVNIYSPHDVLGSNFRNDMRTGDPDVACHATTRAGTAVAAKPSANAVYHASRGPRRPSFLSWIHLYGMRTHGLYWTEDPASEDALIVLPDSGESWQDRILQGVPVPPT